MRERERERERGEKRKTGTERETDRQSVSSWKESRGRKSEGQTWKEKLVPRQRNQLGDDMHKKKDRQTERKKQRKKERIKVRKQ